MDDKKVRRQKEKNRLHISPRRTPARGIASFDAESFPRARSHRLTRHSPIACLSDVERPSLRHRAMETSSWMPRVEHPSQSTSTFGSGSAATVAAVSAAKIDGGECGPAVDDARLCLRNVGPDASVRSRRPARAFSIVVR